MRHVSTHLVGGICGPIWWPVGAMCGKPLSVDLHRKRDRFSDPAGLTLRELLLSVDMEEGGDFQSSKFTADTEIVCTWRSDCGRRTVTRRRALVDLPPASDIADMLNPDVMSWYFCGEDA